MTTTALSRREQFTTFAEMQTVAEVLAASGFFPDAKDGAKAVAKILAGRELGFGPMASMMGVYVIQGKVTLSATLMAAAIKRTRRYDYRIVTMDDKACTIQFYDGGAPCGESTFTLRDALAAGLSMKPTWRAYPRNMLFSRALSNGARWYCPDVFGGPVYTPEEFGATVDAEGTVLALPKDTTPIQTFDSIPAVVARLTERHGAKWIFEPRITRAYFGEALRSPEEMGEFLQQDPDRWTAGCEALLDGDAA